MEVTTAIGNEFRDIYIVDITLPDNIVIPGVEACHINPDRDHDALIGMDIISMGDFAVSNYNGKTAFTFRMPSQGVIDFTDP